MTWKAYLWLLGWFTLMGLGIYVQNKLRPSKETEGDLFATPDLDRKKYMADQKIDEKNTSLI